MFKAKENFSQDHKLDCFILNTFLLTVRLYVKKKLKIKNPFKWLHLMF